jgi:hypothetical protein
MPNTDGLLLGRTGRYTLWERQVRRRGRGGGDIKRVIYTNEEMRGEGLFRGERRRFYEGGDSNEGRSGRRYGGGRFYEGGRRGRFYEGGRRGRL